MTALAELIRESWAGWLDEPLEASVFGTTDPEAISRLLDGFAREHLGARIADALGYHASVGCTALVRLDDGHEVAIKVHQPGCSAAFLASVVTVQRHLHACGLPAPQPRAGPAPIGATLATADVLLPDPGPATGAIDRLRSASAAGLAALIATARPLVGEPSVRGLDEHPMIEPAGALWGRPHSPLFDFSRPAPHTDEIDALGRAARRARDADPAGVVIAHGDWTVRNLRFRDGALVAIYDWDSLIRFRESRAVGQAAQTWNATGDAGSPPRPDVAEIAAYVGAYETARGAPFTAVERRAIGGAALHTLAYSARCEVALQARWPDHEHPHHALDQVLADGDRLLSL
jgi:hypothetical protein